MNLARSIKNMTSSFFIVLVFSCQQSTTVDNKSVVEVDDKVKITGKGLLYSSAIVKKKTKEKSVDVNVKIKGLKRLFLVVESGNDGNTNDWANWVEPRLVNSKGELKLTDLEWVKAEAEWGGVYKNRNAKNNPIVVNGKKVSYAIGTHAYSVIEFSIPSGYDFFKARGVLDDEGLTAATSVQFKVYAKKPKSKSRTNNSKKKLEIRDETEVPLKSFTTTDDLEVTIWAQSPLFYNPTNMDIDAKGRIWVAEGMNYRRSKLRPEGDRIVVVSDSDGDGQADTSHVFVQDKELVSPLGVAVVGNKVFVAQPPHMIVYTDVNEDAVFDPKVDKRENFLSGFGGWNHDHSLHSLTVGPGGQYYFNIGNSGTGLIVDKSNRAFRIGSWYDANGSIPRKNKVSYTGQKSDDGHVYVGGTAFRVNPDGTQLNVIGFNFRNSYEQTVSSFGDVFNNDNDEPPHCRTTWLMEFGNLGYNSNDGLRSWQMTKRPGQSNKVAHWSQEDPGVIPSGDVYGGGAPAGIAFYENGALPPKYNGMVLSCEAARNVVFGYLPKPIGAGLTMDNFKFLTTNVEEKFAGNDFAIKDMGQRLNTMFRPSDVTVGPDGAIYVADWFDARVGGHATYDKKGSGTIYRVAPKDFKSVIPKLDLKTIKGQVEALKNPAVNVRALGLYALEKSGEAAAPDVARLLKHDNVYIRARGIWALSKLGSAGLKYVEAELLNKNVQLRITAFRALRRAKYNMFKHALVLAGDPDMGVRREVALAMRDASYEKSAAILKKLAEGYIKEDRWYLEAFGSGCSGKEEKIFADLNRSMGGDPLNWSDRFADIAWRLHPKVALNAFKTRAYSAKINHKERVRTLTAIAFIESQEAARLMLNLAKNGPQDTQALANWWVFNPEKNVWRDYPFIADVIKPKPVTQDYLVPKLLGAETKLPKLKEVLALKGDASKGAGLAARCYVCHSIKGIGVNFGPDLSEFGKTQSREVIAKAILDPDSDIAHGYEGYEVTMKNGKRLQGTITSKSRRTTTMVLFGGVQMTLDTKQIKRTKKMKKSLMMSAAKMGMSAQDLRDVTEYLKTLK